MGWKHNTPGCSTTPACKCAGGSCGTICGTITNCTGPEVGAGVTLKSGSTVVSSTTTDASGHYCVTIPGAGTYTFAVTPHSPNYQSYSQTSAWACANYTLTRMLLPAAGYSCAPMGCCLSADQVGPPYPAIDWPTTVYLNDGFGVIAVTGGGVGNPIWTGAATRIAAISYQSPCDFLTTTANASVPVYFLLSCNAIYVACQMCNDPTHGCVPPTTGSVNRPYYPSFNANPADPCFQPVATAFYWMQSFGSVGGSPHCPPLFTGSISVSFGVAGASEAPYQIYGPTGLFTFTQ